MAIRTGDELMSAVVACVIALSILSPPSRTSGQPDSPEHVLALGRARTIGARIAAARALGVRADASALESLTRCVTGDPDAAVRGVCATSLGNIGDARALPVLHRALHDGTPAVRSAARRAIRAIRERAGCSGAFCGDDRMVAPVPPPTSHR